MSRRSLSWRSFGGEAILSLLHVSLGIEVNDGSYWFTFDGKQFQDLTVDENEEG